MQIITEYPMKMNLVRDEDDDEVEVEDDEVEVEDDDEVEVTEVTLQQVLILQIKQHEVEIILEE